jgi:hypothetical protein
MSATKLMFSSRSIQRDAPVLGYMRWGPRHQIPSRVGVLLEQELIMCQSEICVQTAGTYAGTHAGLKKVQTRAFH